MNLFYFCLLVGIILLSNGIVTPANATVLYVCPSTINGTNHLQIPVGTNIGGSTNITIAMSTPCTLCMLVRFTSLTGNVSSLNMQDWNMVPVARSYLSNSWENVAGPYVDKLKVSCGTSNCILTIPHLATSVTTPVHFALLTTNRRVSTKEQVARFLEQVTFGPTRADIDIFNTSKSLNKQFAAWVQGHMDPSIVTPTSHREYFRARVDNVMYKGRYTMSTRPRNPCLVNSRWRKYSFFHSDYSSKLIVTTFNETFFLFTVDGIARTIASSFQARYDDGTVVNLLVGKIYSFSWWTEEYVGGDVGINDGVNWYLLVGGNPALYLPQSIIEQYNTTINILQLPEKQYFQDVERVAYDPNGQQFYVGAGIMSTVNFTDPKCRTTTSSMNLIGVFSDNDQYYYDPRIILDRNTVDNPIPDGGGLSGTLCSNVAKNFLNLNKCTLSTASSACMPFKPPNFSIILNNTNLNLLFQGSNRYVYEISGLRVEAGYVLSPCTPSRRHRWMITDPSSCSTTAGISDQTIKALTAMLNDYEWATNSLYADVHLQWRSEYSGSYGGYICDASNVNTIGMILSRNVNGNIICYKHIHPDEGSVYDFTYWTLPDTHPGNVAAVAAGHLPPITKWANSGTFTLPFPIDHNMDRWENNKDFFDYVGRSYDSVNFMDLPSMLRTQAVANIFTPPMNTLQAVVVCGSHGEVPNNSSMTNVFSFANSGGPKLESKLSLQKSNVWNMITLSAKDQLRQRMAWALSQILIISPKQISEVGLSEAYLNYYDIFVRNAFGNYRDVLKEVSQNPMMAEMLSFLESKSSAYVLREIGMTARPDENFAREIMQLFSIGVNLLNLDGTVKVSPKTGVPIPTYRNSNIQTFARAWTGFLRQSSRGNIENWDWYPNRIDPMDMNPRWRDVFPKMDLYGGYIGDSYPLCSDLPKKQFLNIGAKYILLGSSAVPEYQTGDEWWSESWWKPYNTLVTLSLNTTSSALYAALCNAGSGNKCRFQPVVSLNQPLSCEGQECLIDEPRTLRVSNDPPVYYEYIRPACVELTFFSSGHVVRDNWYEGPWPGICANPTVDKASEACCPVGENGGYMFCLYTGERVLYNTAASRCSANSRFRNGDMCKWSWINGEDSNPGCAVWVPQYESWFWTNHVCTIQMKVDNTGNIAVAHVAQPLAGVMFQDYNITNGNFFPFSWLNNAFPTPSTNCTGSNGACILESKSGVCLCNVTVVDSPVFFTRPNVTDVISSLHIGSLPPSWFGASYLLTEAGDGVDVYQPIGTSKYTMSTIFGVTVKGQVKYFKNMLSTIVIGSGNNKFSARNPPHFVNFILPDKRDVMYETDAVIDHYFYHPNVAPFISRKIIQRFGISNPSPRYIYEAATAFTTGTYTSEGITFGDGKYGNLGAMLAAIVLDREARSSVLDADPNYGSLREPMIKLIAFLRAMEYQSRSAVKEVSFLDLTNRIGQMPHESPNVFSFFLPDYTPPGSIKEASLVGPEAQVQTTPTLVGFVNGIIALVEFGLNRCYGGLGETTIWWCPCFQNQGQECNTPPSLYSSGLLNYQPSSLDAEAVVDELSLLLTSGRLSSSYRSTLIKIIGDEIDISRGVKTALKLIAASPAFHATGLLSPSLAEKVDVPAPTPSTKPYKAVVFVNLAGGIDSYNILMPKSKCNTIEKEDLYMNYKSVRGSLALNNNTMLTIDASSSDKQPCKIFGIHPGLTALQQLYNQKDLVFLANVGVLQEYVNDTNWLQKTTKTQLFAHNIQQDEISFVDLFRRASGFGVCGRMVDVVGRRGFKAGSSSVSGVSLALVSKSTPLFVVDPRGVEKINPIPWATDIIPPIKRLNKIEKVGSTVFGETWSNLLLKASSENQLLYDAFTQTSLSATFKTDSLSIQFQAVSKLIKNKDVRGVDRDAFYVKLDGFDTHADMITALADRVAEINDAIGSFVTEMKDQNRWNDVLVVFASEFARTLIPNTSKGSDHAWGGNYFVVGGNLTGGKVLGQYINDFTESSPLIFNPGIVIPTTSWDQVWEPIAKWYGITNEVDLDYVLPSRKNFNGSLTGMFA